MRRIRKYGEVETFGFVGKSVMPNDVLLGTQVIVCFFKVDL